MKKRLFYLFLLSTQLVLSQEYFPKNDGVKESNTNFTAFTNATVHISPTQAVENATLLIQNGKIVSVGSNKIPKNAVIEDVKGMHIYASFIDTYTNFGIKKPKREGGGRSPQYDANREGFYWNDHIRPEQRGIEHFNYDAKNAKTYREAGFGVVNTHLQDGIARGTGVLVALNDSEGDGNRIIEDDYGQFFSFSKSVKSRQSYPTSLMGAMALLRQFHYDADWYAQGNSKTKDRAIEAYNQNKNMHSIFDAGSKSNNLRADKIGDLFNRNYIIVGSGDEYESIEAIKATNATYIIPVNFPEAFDVSNPYLAGYISLEDMREWNQAPINLKSLADNNITFAITTHDLKKPTDVHSKLKRAFAYGFNKQKALASLTTIPASLLGKSNELGTLEKGKTANFLITSGELFEEGTIIYENWVQGTKNTINTKDLKDIRGEYTFTTGGNTYDLSIKGTATKPSATVKKDSTAYTTTLTYKNDWINLSFTDKEASKNYRVTSIVTKNSANFNGKIILPNGNEASYTAIKKSDFVAKSKDKSNDKQQPEVVPLTYPNVGYGYTIKPQQQNILFKNATVWTGEKEGILKNTDVLIKNGTIAKIGNNLSANGAKVIDATGKHLTAGIIDEHTHIATLTVNEAGHNSTAEVTIEDVVDPEDINIYRNLAGGVTSAQILHGSANPIGGRSAIIKMKWGEEASEMIYNNSPKFIKFALGENVKQSNWESYSRFPQTRMGVEQLFVNYFNRAKAYDANKKAGKSQRYDEEMEVIAEILNGERFISCHSYVQSEINMLMKVAEKFNFKVNTFTHILEGYKVADKMKAHGVGGSTFSDWWAYKYEVNDAIPYNAAIMAKQGIVTAINSDDAEMSRRLNQEAGKTVKYGAMSEEEAWKMVTINPAKLLHIDNRVGSIKKGKDADVVLWSDNPLSVYAVPEKTYVEGVAYFEIEKDKQQRIAIKEERNKLIQMMLNDKGSGKGKKRPPMKKDKIHFECETIN